MKAFRALWCILTVGSAQSIPNTPPNPPEYQLPDPAPTIRTRVELVMVPVVVRDPEGNAVGNLTLKDFQLFDKAKLQTISHFSVERREATPVAVAPRANNGEKHLASADGAVIPTRFIAYLIDDLHLPAGEFTAAREAARKHVRDTLQAGDRAAIFTTSGKVMLDFTHDLELLDQALLRITPQPSAMPNRDCPPVTYYMADAILNQNNSDAYEMAMTDYLKCNVAATRLSAGPAVRSAATRVLSQGALDTQITLATLGNVIRRISASPGQRLVVLVSSGFFLTADFRQQESAVIDRAIRSQVTVSTVDARGLYVLTPGGDPSGATRPDVRTAPARTLLENERALSEGETLGEIAQGTGGTWFHNNNDLVAGLNRVAGAPECYYVLGFSPQNLKLDGSFHPLKVSVTAKNVTAQVRYGYFASKGALDPEERAKAEIHEAFLSRGEIVEIPVAVRTEFAKSKPGAVQLSVTAAIDIKGLPFEHSEGKNLDTVTVVAGLFDPDGNLVVDGVAKTIRLAIKDETLKAGKAGAVETRLTFDAPSGSYVLRLVVRDSEGEMIGARNAVLEIP